ncbi:MAG: hypothetical protein E3J70_02800 [Candidatus Heimdallarchaeota archaeon]|nr:MAG: hypothetical protein E3J70_02800 [Candidatus Heimdallarchaeota archaeon]
MVVVVVVNLRTEKIPCILCNKQLATGSRSYKELFICSECQAYFCPDCKQAVKDYDLCPAARLLGVKEHELKFIKILPPKPVQTIAQTIIKEDEKPTVKILPKKGIKILDSKKQTKETK